MTDSSAALSKVTVMVGVVTSYCTPDVLRFAIDRALAEGLLEVGGQYYNTPACNRLEYRSTKRLYELRMMEVHKEVKLEQECPNRDLIISVTNPVGWRQFRAQQGERRRLSSHYSDIKLRSIHVKKRLLVGRPFQ